MKRAPSVTSPTDAALERAAVIAREFIAGLPDRPVAPTTSVEELRRRFGGPLPDAGTDAAEVVDALAANVEGGLIASAGPRFFGFVIGGGVPAAVAADWLTSAWDQNAGLYVIGPAAAVAEEVAGAWLAELFGLPEGVSVGFTTGATMASFTGIAAARHALLSRTGWDVERQGLFGAPEIPVVVSDESHVTIFAALQMLGMGRDRVIRVATDDQGRMRADALREALAALDRPGARLRAGRQRQHRRLRPAAADRRRGPRQRRLAARRRGLRAVGGGRPGAAAPRRGRRGRRLLDDRRPQVAQRAVRLGALVRRRSRRASRGDDARRRVLRRDDGGRARRLQLGARVVAPCPRVHGLGGAAEPGPGRRRRDDRRDAPTSRSGSRPASTASPAPGSSTTSCSTRCSSGSRSRRATPAAGDARTDAVIAASRPTGRCGWAARHGTAGARCGSRCRAGRRPRPTWTPRSR